MSAKGEGTGRNRRRAVVDGDMRWVVVVGIVVVTLVALTAIDKRDEESCKDRWRGYGTVDVNAEKSCDGFLPW